MRAKFRCRAIAHTVCTVYNPLCLWDVPTCVRARVCVCVRVCFTWFLTAASHMNMTFNYLT